MAKPTNFTCQHRASPGTSDSGRVLQRMFRAIPADALPGKTPLASKPEPVSSEQLPEPPEGFVYDPEGSLYAALIKRNGNVGYKLICRFPIYLKTVLQSEHDESRYSLLFRQKEPHSGWRDIVVTVRQGLSETALAGRGVTIHDGKLWRKFVRFSIDRWHKEHRVERPR
jgi:hypothetical protein